MNIYIWLLVATILIAGGNAFVTFRRRNYPGAKIIFFLMLAVAVYAFGYIFEIVSKTLEIKLIWYNIEYLGIAAFPFLWFFFALEFSDRDKLIINKKIYIFAVIPVITIIMVWTNVYHGLMLKDIGIAAGAIHEITKVPGTWYYVNIIYSYLLTAAGSMLLISTVVNLPAPHVRQGITLSIGALIPIIGSILYVFKLTPIKNFDLTPVSCAISGIILSWSIFKLKALQVGPTARAKVFDNIEDAVIVINYENKIIDLNLRAQSLFDIQASEEIGQDIDLFFKIHNIDIRISDLIKNRKSELVLESGRTRFYFSIRSTPFEKKIGIITGYILVFHDITAIKENELFLSNSKQKIEDLNKLAFELDVSEAEEEVCQKSSKAAKSILGVAYCSFVLFKDNKIVNQYNSDSLIGDIVSSKYFLKNFLSKSFSNNVFKIIKTSEFEESAKKKLLKKLRISAFLCAPVLNLGAAVFFSEDRDSFNQENIRMSKLLLGHLAGALKRISLQKSLRDQAEKDSLTGVYNRRYFNNFIDKEIERSKRYKYFITFIMIDIDRFKEINDRFGHQTGDEVLKGIGHILETQIRKIDTLVRYGGDEFLILLLETNDKDINRFISRLKKTVFEWNEKTRLVDFEIKISTGISLWDPSFDEPIEKIIHLADLDMYTDKKNNGE
jgi:diguanylate cyclase (GGDEF)-like protein